MSKNLSDDILIRDKRQITLPRKICEQLGVEPGDHLSLYVEGSTLMARPKKSVALKALQELHRIFQASDISEKELLKTARRMRGSLVRKMYDGKS
jgi:bifunctional DNA-binding transcriptional regulator/antitoxin component of YhaV-PrlF toxin-antitoxin module